MDKTKVNLFKKYRFFRIKMACNFFNYRIIDNLLDNKRYCYHGDALTINRDLFGMDFVT